MISPSVGPTTKSPIRPSISTSAAYSTGGSGPAPSMSLVPNCAPGYVNQAVIGPASGGTVLRYTASETSLLVGFCTS